MSLSGGIKRYLIPSRENAYRPRLLLRGPLIALLAVTLFAEGVLIANLVARHAGVDLLGAVIQSEIVSLTNGERVSGKLALLAESPELTKSAQAKADDMAAKGYFAHQSPDGTEPWSFIEAAGYDYRYAGENLAVRFVDSKDVVGAWMASPSHRSNIVKPQYTDMGVGIAQGMYKGQPATFVVQHFGRPTTIAARVQGAVLGAQTSSASFSDTLARQLGRLLAEPRTTAGWMLGGVAALLMLALGFAFFHHIQVQSRTLLLPGVVVAGIALGLLMLNNTFLVGTSGSGQDAGVYSAVGGGGVVVGTGAYTERQ